MSDQPDSDQVPVVELNTNVMHPARVYDYWLGGKDNFPADAAARLSHGTPMSVTLRSHDQIARFFDGLELVDPGLVQVHRWRPDPSDPDLDRKVSVHSGVARKP